MIEPIKRSDDLIHTINSLILASNKRLLENRSLKYRVEVLEKQLAESKIHYPTK